MPARLIKICDKASAKMINEQIDNNFDDPDELAYWDENVTIGVDMEPDFLEVYQV